KVYDAIGRLLEYPSSSQTRGCAVAGRYGIKPISCSSTFEAYTATALREVGGFPSATILGEDVIIAGKMLLQGWHKAYLGEAQVYHSHDYTLNEEFRRYFDIGVFHSNHSWIFEHFGRAESEGFKYLRSEFSFLLKNNIMLLPK